MIIGVVGPIGSGKSVLVDTLIEKGYTNLRTPSALYEEAAKRGIPRERKPLQDLGNELRAQYGPGYLAEKLVERMEKGKDYVIDSIRNPGEIEVFRKLEGFVLIGFNAPIERRLEWLIKRRKVGDPKNIDEIKAMDARDRGEGEAAHGQNVDACYALADVKIINNGTFEQLTDKVSELLSDLKI